MSSDRRSERLSPFDQMLRENRARLDALYDPSTGDPFAKSEAERGQAGNRLAATRPAPAVPVRPSRGAIDASEPVRKLNERYGSGWRYEIADRRREADEVIVLC